MSEPYSSDVLTVQWYSAMRRINAKAWNSLAADLDSPFLDWEWLHLVESSGSAVPETGWQPHHLTLWQGGRLVAAAPMYIKTNSTGEFVFDQIWAEVSTRLGTAYYPKLLGMSPFTPTGSYRFLTAPDMDESRLTARMHREIERLVQNQGYSGCHFLFVDPAWAESMRMYGYQAWLHQGYVWKNHGYSCFDDYLQTFKSSQRKNIRKERRALDQAGIVIKVSQGAEVTQNKLRTMFRLYVRHNAQFGPWSCRFLTQSFFEELQSCCVDRLLLVEAFRKGETEQPLAMSLLVHKGEKLFGRYWGCFEEVRFLHFELCYYTPVEWAIANNIQFFDPGVGGFHKTRRGFLAVPSVSLHKFRDLRMRMIMETHMDEINALEQSHMEELNEMLPTLIKR